MKTIETLCLENVIHTCFDRSKNNYQC